MIPNFGDSSGRKHDMTILRTDNVRSIRGRLDFETWTDQTTKKNKPRRNGWWDEEVKEAILRRKEACRQHRKYNRLREAFPEVISREKVEEKLVAYLEMKQVAKDLVAKKRLQERDEVLREFRNSGGYG